MNFFERARAEKASEGYRQAAALLRENRYRVDHAVSSWLESEAVQINRDGVKDVRSHSYNVAREVLLSVCGCKPNEGGDAPCHQCGQYTNMQCWNCYTMRAAGHCPRPPRTRQPLA